MNISNFIKNISKITNYNELSSNKDINSIIHSNNNEEISKIIDMKNSNILDIIHQLILSVIDNENKMLLNHLINNNIEQYYPSNDIVYFIFEKKRI